LSFLTFCHRIHDIKSYIYLNNVRTTYIGNSVPKSLELTYNFMQLFLTYIINKVALIYIYY